MDDIPSPRNAEAVLPLGELRALADRLASARQAAGITLEELAGRLCIGQDQLRALETADVNHLPELVFVIAQARRVAAILGIDAEDTIKHLRAAHRPRPVGASTSTQASAGRTTTIPTRPLRATGAAGFRPGGSWRPAAALLGLGAALAGGLLVLSSLGRNPLTAHTEQGHPQALPTTPFPAAKVTTSAPVASAPIAGTAVASAAPERLMLRSQEDSWLEVRDSEGRSLFQGTLKGEKSFPLGQGLQVMAGRPDLVMAQVSGSPSKRLGTIDQVIWHSFAASPKPSLPKNGGSGDPDGASGAAAAPTAPRVPAP